MKDYAIYCTSEQIFKAFELGAPVLAEPDFFGGRTWLKVTAEQMIGWLDEKEVHIEIVMSTEDWQWSYLINKGIDDKTFYTRKKAIISAIDEALDCLIKRTEK